MKRINIQSHMKQLFREEDKYGSFTNIRRSYTKDMPLVDQIKFYYDVDIDNYLGDPWEILAECAVDSHWLEEFNKLIFRRIFTRKGIHKMNEIIVETETNIDETYEALNDLSESIALDT